MAKQTENAKRFINTYNQIDMALRVQGDMKRSISYTEAIRRAARTNAIVAKYEDKLIDYGRLRNAIVHSSNENMTIAEPYTEVVEEYEKIASLICTPPLALESICLKDVQCVNYDVKLCDVLSYMHKSGFSNLPVYKDGMLIGIANSGKIARVLGAKIYEKRNMADYLNTQIGEVVREYASEGFYTIVDKKVTLDTIMNLFTENRKLLIVLMTPTGSLLEAPIGIISISDIIEINKVLDNY